MNQHWSLKGKKAVITGGSRGIGKAITEQLCQFGAEVIFAARNKAQNLEIEKELRVQGHKAISFNCDLSDRTGRNEFSAFIEKNWKKVDILINNIGTNIRKPAEEYSTEEIEKIFNTNLFSAFQLSLSLLPLLKSSGSASIVNISSVAGAGHIRTGVAYGMTKAAMNQMTKNLAVEWSKYNIRVNAILPWYIRTPLAEQVLKNKDYLDEVLSRTPMKRIGEPEEVAAMAVFLSLPASSYITGQIVSVDGGFSINMF